MMLMTMASAIVINNSWGGKQASGQRAGSADLRLFFLLEFPFNCHHSWKHGVQEKFRGFPNSLVLDLEVLKVSQLSEFG